MFLDPSNEGRDHVLYYLHLNLGVDTVPGGVERWDIHCVLDASRKKESHFEGLVKGLAIEIRGLASQF